MIKIKPYKYKYLKCIKTTNRNVLEIGIGNNSPEMFNKYYNNCVYDGVDKNLDYNLSSKSVNLLNNFYQIDLEIDSLNKIPNNKYDYIIVSHVIEHIKNGEDVVTELSYKLKSGGIIYIEYPSKRSANFPSMKGTLNFYDDPTHKRFYDLNIIKSVLLDNGLDIINGGIKRDYFRVFGIPFMIMKSIVSLGYIRGSIFWDLLGFAEFIVARKK